MEFLIWGYQISYFTLKLKSKYLTRYVNSQNTAISLNPIHFINKIKIILYMQIRNSITHLTIGHRRPPPPSPMTFKAFLLFTKADNPWEPGSSSRPFLGIIFYCRSIIMYNSTALCGFCCKKRYPATQLWRVLPLDPWKKHGNSHVFFPIIN